MLPELNDEIYREDDGRTHPAYVYSRSNLGSAQYGSIPDQEDMFVGFSLAQTLQAVLAPGTNWQINERVRWEGREYIVSQVALRKDIDGDAHHMTLTFQIPD